MNSEVPKILFVDDDKDILSLLKYNLEREGYQVKTLNKPVDAVKLAKRYHPDLIILDVMMPELNGIEVCRQLRSFKEFENTTIFFLSAKSEYYMEMAALETGGDDYIEKVTGLRSLTFKIQTVLKDEMIIRKRDKNICIKDIELHRETYSISYDNQYFLLTKTEFELLYFMAQNPKITISKDHIIHNIWGSEIYMLSRSIDNYIENIKRKVRKELVEKVGDKGFRLNFV